MNRRTLLAGIAGASATTAGCLDVFGHSNSVEDRPLAEYGCPPFERDATWDRVRCSQTVDTDEAEVYLQPTTERTSDPEVLSFVLTNDSTETLRLNPGNWALRKREPDGWRSLEKTVVANGYVDVEPGTTHEWPAMDVAAFFTDWNFDYPPSTYLAGVAVPDPHSEDWLRCAALFRITD